MELCKGECHLLEYANLAFIKYVYMKSHSIFQNSFNRNYRKKFLKNTYRKKNFKIFLDQQGALNFEFFWPGL